MQLVCPACSARYLVSPAALGEEGKDVRCAKCGHQWFQVAQVKTQGSAQVTGDSVDDMVNNLEDKLRDGELEDELEGEFGNIAESDSGDNSVDNSGDSFGDKSEDSEVPESQASQESGGNVEDIPDGVKPTNESKNVPAFAEDVIRPQVGRFAKVAGFATAACLFGLFVTGGLLFKKQIIGAWLPAVSIYQMVGMPVDFLGKELVIENLSAKSQRDVDGKNFLLLQGRVVNLTNEEQAVPPLYVRLRSTHGVDGQGWEIEPSLESLSPGESFTFQSDYPALPDGTGSVNISFVPTVKGQ